MFPDPGVGKLPSADSGFVIKVLCWQDPSKDPVISSDVKSEKLTVSSTPCSSTFNWFINVW